MPVAPKRIIKEIRSLRHKKFRQEKQAYFAEGIAIVLSALENQAPVQYVIYSPELLRSETAYEAISEARAVYRAMRLAPKRSCPYPDAITLWVSVR